MPGQPVRGSPGFKNPSDKAKRMRGAAGAGLMTDTTISRGPAATRLFNATLACLEGSDSRSAMFRAARSQAAGGLLQEFLDRASSTPDPAGAVWANLLLGVTGSVK